MCNLYSLTTNRQAVLRVFRVSDNRAAAFESKDAIFPGHTAAVVRVAEDDVRELVNMSWGFVLPQKGRAPRRVTNTRDDKVRSSRFWLSSFEERRCLVPVSSFAEPKEVTPATWHWFALKGDEPRPVFAFAGLWKHHIGPVKKDGPSVEIDVYSFLTTTPNSLVGSINHERMPVLLSTDEEFETWMTGSPDEAFKLIREYPPNKMRMVQSGYEKRDMLDAS
ncbi:MAG: SOS response-associated peptidase [Hyphomicrobiaceae bacterium]